MITLSKEQVIRLHEKLIYDTGGLGGVSDEVMLESSLECALHTVDGADLYPSTQSKIAAITFSLIRNRPFVDGNKRIGACVMLVLLELNHIIADFDDEELIHIGEGVAAGRISAEQLQRLVERHIPKQAKLGLFLHEQEPFYSFQTNCYFQGYQRMGFEAIDSLNGS